MENSNLAGVIDFPGDNIPRLSRCWELSHVARREMSRWENLPSLQFLLGADPTGARAAVTLIGKDKKDEAQGGKINDLVPPVDAPHLLDCQTLTRMELRKKYPGEATSIATC